MEFNASVGWAIATGAVTFLAPQRSLIAIWAVFFGVVGTQYFGYLTPTTWATADCIGVAICAYLYGRHFDKAALYILVILSIRIVLHVSFFTNPFDLYSYYLAANVMYGLTLGAALWNYYRGRLPL